MNLRQAGENDSVRSAEWKEVVVLPKPKLEFRYGQRVYDPRDGLSLFGPLDTDKSASPKSISYAVMNVSRSGEICRIFKMSNLSYNI